MKNINKTNNTKKEKIYKFTDSNGNTYLNNNPGLPDGNKKLNCPSAKKWIEKSYYVNNKVFFENENIAISAGYRPCAICIPDKYKIWKEKNIKKLSLKKV